MRKVFPEKRLKVGDFISIEFGIVCWFSSADFGRRGSGYAFRVVSLKQKMVVNETGELVRF